MKVFIVSKTNPKDRKEITQIEALKMSLSGIPVTHEIQILSETGSDLKDFKSELSQQQRIDLDAKHAKISRNSDGQYYFRHLTADEIHISLIGAKAKSDREKEKRDLLKDTILSFKEEIIISFRAVNPEYTKEELSALMDRLAFVIK